MWTYTDKSHDAVTNEIDRLEDRGAALVAGAFLEQRLQDMIAAGFQRNQNIENKVFRGVGPLATFSAKIDLGLLLGFFDEETHKRLHIIREIRNEFAHNIQPTTFESQRVRDLCGNLPAVRTAKPDIQFSALQVGADGNNDFSQFGKYLIQSILHADDTRRNRYMVSIKLYLFMFALMAEKARYRAKEGPLWPPPSADTSGQPTPQER